MKITHITACLLLFFGISISLYAQPSRTFTIKGVQFKMIRVEPGTFTMGVDGKEKAAAPAHKVTISKPYYILESEVTENLWNVVMGGGKAAGNMPKHSMTYTEICDPEKGFLSKLNKALNAKFRLPTEAEWEYAARGGHKSKSKLYSGSENAEEVAVFSSAKDKKAKLSPVKSKAPNELGIYDMSGNLWEWCSDWYGKYTLKASTDPTGPSLGAYRILRGGSYSDYIRGCEVTFRNYDVPDAVSDVHGFRFVLEVK